MNPVLRGSTPDVAEIVIAGAGMAGIAAAHQLAVREGVGRVVIVDPRDPFSLTSSKGTEAYRNYWPGPDDTMVRFMDRSIDLLDALDADTAHAFELNRRGYVFLTADPAEAERLRVHEGPTTEFIDSGRMIHARYPFVTDRVRAMLHVRRAGFMNAATLGQCLLERARVHGVDLVRDEVTDLVVHNGRFAAVRLASGSRIDARAFVLAAGPLLAEWADRLRPVRADRQRAARQDFVRGSCRRDSARRAAHDLERRGRSRRARDLSRRCALSYPRQASRFLESGPMTRASSVHRFPRRSRLTTLTSSSEAWLR